MKKQVIGMVCSLCKERFYKNGHMSDEELKKYARDKVHVVEKLPMYCSRCGGHLRIIKKYILSTSNRVLVKDDN